MNARKSENPDHSASHAMTVEFEFVLDELLDVTEQYLLRRPFLRRARKWNLAAAGALAGLVVFLIVRASLEYRLCFGALAFGVGMLAEHALVGLRRRGLLRAAIREQARGEGPFRCVVTADPSGLTVTQMDMTLHRPWHAIDSVVDSDRGVEILARDGSLTVVRSRAFDSPDQRAEWMALIRGFVSSETAIAPEKGAGSKESPAI